jgi:hypothetical protein
MINFDLGGITTVEFGVGRDEGFDNIFVLIPVDINVQDALKEMAGNTLKALN